jgi:hypothetical protein
LETTEAGKSLEALTGDPDTTVLSLWVAGLFSEKQTPIFSQNNNNSF